MKTNILEIYELPKELETVDLSSNCILNENCIEFKDNKIAFGVKNAKTNVRTAKKTLDNCTFTVNPQGTYVTDLGENKTCSARPMTMVVQSNSNTYQST